MDTALLYLFLQASVPILGSQIQVRILFVLLRVISLGITRSKQEWNKMEGLHFDYEEFFWTIHGLFDDTAWGKGIIELWNKVVLGTSPKPTAALSEARPSHLDQMKALRAAKKDTEVAAVAEAATAAATAVPAPAPALAPAPESIDADAPA
ncbi:hypothetical protein DFH07DRAFT_984056 [Mycena maculata]|uniref:Uncharacterized protein n=1 Tax=Mycena maculata TaxID=230809 RepID=A0AAD7MYL6_9AGAR|nr:hypothetical protein DFH07DRAFT_984056 [Mycena maculata]